MRKMSLPVGLLCLVVTTACGGGSIPSCRKVPCPHPAGTYVFDGVLQEVPEYVEILQEEERADAN